MDKLFTGRISGKSNIQEIPHHWKSDLQLYSDCRNESKGWENCETCNERFRCWTALQQEVTFDEKK